MFFPVAAFREMLRVLRPNGRLAFAVWGRSEVNPFWRSDMAAPHGIDFDLALDIGDFGLGSDAPILLDYREDAAEPRVIRLRWVGSGKCNEWVVMAPTFGNFVEALGL